MYSHILLPTDGSELALKAVRHGIALAKVCGAKVTVITVCPPLDDFVAEGVAITISQDDRAAFKKQMGHNLDAGLEEARRSGVEAKGLQADSAQPWRAIVEAADEIGADLIVIGSHGRRGLSALVLGSETNKVLTHTKVPVLVCR